MKRDLRSITKEQLEAEVSDAGFERFRARQIFRSVHKNKVKEIGKIHGLPKDIKEFLNTGYQIKIPHVLQTSVSGKYETFKYLLNMGGTKNGNRIESVLINEGRRNTVCVSTQVGCNVGCEFCATGKMGFSKNLSAGDIVSQVYTVCDQTGLDPTNLVFMGMGEPFLNYSNTISSLKILTDPEGLAVSSRRITISTVGFKGRIKKFADDISSEKNYQIRNVKLALSLHSTDRGLREALIPTSKVNELSAIYDELIYFYRKTGNKVTIEYIVFPGLNDTDKDVARIEKISRMVPSNVNVIPFHPINFKLSEPISYLNSFSDKQNSLSKRNINNFIAALRDRRVVVNLRKSSGEDINAACGQLAAIEKIK